MKRDKKWFKDRFELIRLHFLNRAVALKVGNKKSAKLDADIIMEILYEIFDDGYSFGYNTAQGEFAKELKKLEQDNKFPNIGDRRR